MTFKTAKLTTGNIQGFDGKPSIRSKQVTKRVVLGYNDLGTWIMFHGSKGRA